MGNEQMKLKERLKGKGGPQQPQAAAPGMPAQQQEVPRRGS